MPMDSPWNYPTLMCTPPGRAGGVFPTETVLPLEAEAYAVTREGDIWWVASGVRTFAQPPIWRLNA